MDEFTCRIERDAKTGRYRAEVRELKTMELVFPGPFGDTPEMARFKAAQKLAAWHAAVSDVPARLHKRDAVASRN